MISGNDGDDPKVSLWRKVNVARRWVEDFGIELWHTNILFWLRSPERPAKNILLTAAAAVLIFSARKTYASNSSLTGVPPTLALVFLVSLALSFFACLFDSELSRHGTTKYTHNAKSLCQLLIVGSLLSAALISLNYGLRWSERITWYLSPESEISEVAFAFAVPAAAGALSLILLRSSRQPDFAEKFKLQPSRATSWIFIYFVMLCILNIVMFVNYTWFSQFITSENIKRLMGLVKH